MAVLGNCAAKTWGGGGLVRPQASEPTPAGSRKGTSQFVDDDCNGVSS